MEKISFKVIEIPKNSSLNIKKEMKQMKLMKSIHIHLIIIKY